MQPMFVKKASDADPRQLFFYFVDIGVPSVPGHVQICDDRHPHHCQDPNVLHAIRLGHPVLLIRNPARTLRVCQQWQRREQMREGLCHDFPRNFLGAIASTYFIMVTGQFLFFDVRFCRCDANCG